jgi:hypothetical protein
MVVEVAASSSSYLYRSGAYLPFRGKAVCLLSVRMYAKEGMTLLWLEKLLEKLLSALFSIINITDACYVSSVL